MAKDIYHAKARKQGYKTAKLWFTPIKIAWFADKTVFIISILLVSE